MPDGAKPGFGAGLHTALGGRRWPVAVLILFTLGTGFLGLGSGLLVLAELEARRWPRVEAEIVGVTERPLRSRTPRLYDLRLVAEIPDGRRVEGETIAPYRWRSSWSDPRPPPGVGDRIAVFVDPDDPRRMRPLTTWPPLWENALHAVLFSGASLAFLAVLIALWRARRAARTGGPDAAARL
ncbi:MAG TPA: DUF3592 domain-containing protein [Acetobacteraceae bacterium]|nr:DUF3592 domain-containing protein [Acetobacteraceae bacterium]